MGIDDEFGIETDKSKIERLELQLKAALAAVPYYEDRLRDKTALAVIGPIWNMVLVAKPVSANKIDKRVSCHAFEFAGAFMAERKKRMKGESDCELREKPRKGNAAWHRIADGYLSAMGKSTTGDLGEKITVIGEKWNRLSRANEAIKKAYKKGQRMNMRGWTHDGQFGAHIVEHRIP